jgi:hypothetical protein
VITPTQSTKISLVSRRGYDSIFLPYQKHGIAFGLLGEKRVPPLLHVAARLFQTFEVNGIHFRKLDLLLGKAVYLGFDE